MATGRAPFIGETAAVIFDEILRRGGATEEADTDTLANFPAGYTRTQGVNPFTTAARLQYSPVFLEHPC